MKAFLTLFLTLSVTTSAQEASKYVCKKPDLAKVQEYLSHQTQNDALAEDVRRTRAGRLPFCWQSCVIRLPKPYFPELAKQYQVSGRVKVYAIADGDGHIIYAQPMSGPKMLRSYATAAACASQFEPVLYEKKAIRFPWTIVYNFTK